MNEPRQPQSSRPCSTPHSAPIAWLKYDPGIEPPATTPAEPEGSVLSEVEGLTPEQQRQQEVDTFLAAYERVAPDAERRDGWTPFLRKLFLQVVADTGRVALACAYTGMSRQSAYALAARDRVFAAGWDAAAHFARMPLADDIYEKGMEGITETVTRSDGVTVTRHRYDSRLSIAVLNRLDRRCDRAEERGSRHLAAVRNWGEYLSLVGNGDDRAAEALLDRPVRGGAKGVEDCQNCQLPERAFPIPQPDPPGSDPFENVWKNDDGVWMTTFPPPPGFDGYENTAWDGLTYYERACTPEEAQLIEAHQAAAEAEEVAEATAFAEAERDGFFAKLRSELRAGDPAMTGSIPLANPADLP